MTLRTEARTDIESVTPETTAGALFVLEEKVQGFQPEEQGLPVDGSGGEGPSLGGLSPEGGAHLPGSGGFASEPCEPGQGGVLEEGFFVVCVVARMGFGAERTPDHGPHRGLFDRGGEGQGVGRKIKSALDSQAGLFGTCSSFHGPLCGALGVHLGQHTLQLVREGHGASPGQKGRARRASAGSQGETALPQGATGGQIHRKTPHRNGSSAPEDVESSSYFVDTETGGRYGWVEVARAVRAAPRKSHLIEQSSDLVTPGDEPMTTMMTPQIPTTNDELVKYWSLFVASELRRLGRTKFNAEDMLQSVFLSLFARGVVEKFWAGAQERSHPLVVAASDAARMLGITWEAFVMHQIVAEGTEEGLAPVDTEGKRGGAFGVTDHQALYLFTDVVALSATVTFPDQGTLWLPEPKKPTVAQWRAYLGVAVRNASANVTRSWSRHESKEHAPDRFKQFRDPETGAVRFEESLVDEVAQGAVEQSFDVSSLLKRAPGLGTRRTSEGKNFFDLLKDGYSIREATREVRLSRQEKRVLSRHVGELVLLYPALG